MSDQPQNPLNATEKFDPMSLAQKSNFDSPTQGWDAAGIFSSSANLIYDGIKGDWGAMAGDAAAFGMDLLGFVTNPMGSLLSAGIGWLIEHIGFLKEGLDLLAGDPDAVNAMALTWSNIAKRMQETADKYTSTLDALSQSQGAAVDGYRKAVQDFSNVVTGGANHATSAASAMTVAASAVGVVRGAVRDAIASFVSNAIIKFAAASALTPITFGASQAAFIADTVVQGTITAGKNAKKISKVVKQLEKVADDAKRSRDTIKGTTRNLRSTVKTYNQDAVRHSQQALHLVKKAQAGKLDAGDADRIRELGEQGRKLQHDHSSVKRELGENVNDNLRSSLGLGNRRLDDLNGLLDGQVVPRFGKNDDLGLPGREFPGISVPMAPKVLGNAIAQEWSDQSHREADAQVKQNERDQEWREYWQQQRMAGEL
ncbi:hypothetical protein ACIRG5_33875 [Lentzea sp. NPDC102401]|uniref:hypothetical protein n=1 Tax=Lentzea sp. NPDC102401 TaxID=3364128 RepID=UPI00382F03F0